MVPSFQDEISIRPAETDFTLRLHGENNVHPGKGEQFPPGIYLQKTHRWPLILKYSQNDEIL